jgi:hypothetical protein
MAVIEQSHSAVKLRSALLDHRLSIFASAFVPAAAALVPTCACHLRFLL